MADAIKNHEKKLDQLAQAASDEQQSGQFEAAEKRLEELADYREVKSELIKLYLGWAEARAARETRDEARRVVEKLLALDDQNSAAAELRRRIDALFGPVETLTLDCDDGVQMQMKLIPAETFRMGSPAGEAGRDSDEGPQHEVTISQWFYIGVHEVTEAQWQAVSASVRACWRGPSPTRGRRLGPELPILPGLLQSGRPRLGEPGTVGGAGLAARGTGWAARRHVLKCTRACRSLRWVSTMADSGSGEVTRLLTAAARGDSAAANRVWSAVYDELHRLARQQLAREGGRCSFDSTTLVHEAYLRLVGPGPVAWDSRRHFFGAAARAMRNIRVDDARRRGRVRRGSNHRPGPLVEEQPIFDDDPLEVLAVDEAVQALEQAEPRRAEVVLLRYFVGLSVDETAAVLDISPRTVDDEWRFAKAWLHRELTKGESTATMRVDGYDAGDDPKGL